MKLQSIEVVRDRDFSTDTPKLLLNSMLSINDICYIWDDVYREEYWFTMDKYI